MIPARKKDGIGLLVLSPFPQGSLAPEAGYLPIPLLFLCGVPMECQAPELREDSQLIHLSQALDAVAMEIEDTQVEESCQDLLGKKTESQAGQDPGSVLSTDLQAEKEVWGAACLPFYSHPTILSFAFEGVQGYHSDTAVV